MGKRIVLLPKDPQRKPQKTAADEPWEPGKERRADPRRSGLPRRVRPDRRQRGTSAAPKPGELRGGVRRCHTDRRRQRDRRFGLDPTLYDRLVDLDL